MAGFLDNFGAQSNSGVFSRIAETARKLGNFGMEYKDLVVKNSQAMGAAEYSMRERFGFAQEDEDFIYSIAAQDTSNRKYIASFDKEVPFKIDFLRKFAMNSEIEYILDTICDDGIVYDKKNFFCHPSLLNLDLKPEVIQAIRENFRRIYVLHGMVNALTGWQYFRQLLVDGFIAFEIVYSSDGKKIVGFKELDALSLTPSVEKQPDGTHVQIWYQYYGDSVRQRKLYDGQIIYISYAKGSQVTRTSYCERLVRSYNLLRIMEHTRIIWNVMNSQYRIKMTIPVGSRSPQKAKETLGELMSVYKEDIKLDTTSGNLTINGRPNLQFYKNYLFPQMGGESPKVETINPQGPNLNVMEAVVYFSNKLKMDSKIPYNRFAARSGGQAGMFKIAAEGAERDEVRYGKFITRIRSIFQEIIIKPLWIQMVLDFPDLKEDALFRSQLGIKFESDNVFGESREIEQLIKTIDFISAASEIKEKVGEEEVPFFNQDFLIDKYLGLNNEDRRMNDIYLEKEKEAGEAAKPAEGETEEAAPAAETPTEEAPTEETPAPEEAAPEGETTGEA